MHNRTIAAIAASSLLAVFAAQAQKGAAYSAPAQEPEYARFTLTGGATYLLPSMNGLDYALSINSLTGSIAPQQIDRSYNWGYYLAAGYMISDRYDVQVSWTQFDTNNDDSFTNCDVCVAVDSNGFPLGSDVFTSITHESLNTQAFDGTLGQYHQLGENLMTRIFAGVRYAKITNNTTNDSIIDGALARLNNYDSSFSGVGPELGFDVNYDVYDWFGIVGHFAGAFLIGNQETKGQVFANVPPDGYGFPDTGDLTRMIPALDAKLGLDLNVPFWNNEDRFGIEAGYQVAYYFNVVDQYQTLGEEPGSAQHHYADVGLMGPYANLSVKF